ncbi:hypothetical protein TEA_019863 [Camellia sinensis var. sinensis]|uniref:Homeobox domain-containing protein n=1 Tax=Camellia sinensis var. sinensis TaxID=542762 RepID=A0A4S4E2V4_CAMSN|nr:hypothetical protein TEA_019863 [Camellia sinensis var. sinensis]
MALKSLETNGAQQESQKLALAESTGLDQKQINNWFINQRKRHWKPSEDMQFVVMDATHPHYYMDNVMVSEEQFFKHFGNGPVKLLPFTVNSSRARPMHNPGGSSPEMPLLEKLAFNKRLFFPKSSAMLLEKLLV